MWNVSIVEFLGELSLEFMCATHVGLIHTLFMARGECFMMTNDSERSDIQTDAYSRNISYNNHNILKRDFSTV